MRDIASYSEEYYKLEFEKYEVKFRRNKILKIMGDHAFKSILEIGCGMEPIFLFYDTYDRYTLIEPSLRFYENALKLNENIAGTERRTLINDYFGINTRVYESKYDFILCSSLLHELEDPDSFLRFIADACDDDTIVHINVPNATSFHRILAARMGVIGDVHQLSERNIAFQQHNVYGMDELIETVENAGFEVIDKGGFFIKPFTHAQLSSMLLGNIIDERTLDGLELMSEDLPDMCSEIYVNVRKKH